MARTETVCLTNMCMVEDGKGNVVALDKIKGGYTGLTFPGGHAEEGESFYDSVIREVREETGLTISDPLLTGVYQWTEGGIRNVIFLYKACKFTGELTDSPEGHVFWVPLEEFDAMELAEGMHDVVAIMNSDKFECFSGHDSNGDYWGVLL